MLRTAAETGTISRFLTIAVRSNLNGVLSGKILWSFLLEILHLRVNCFLLLDHASWTWFIGCSLLGLRSCSRGVRALTIATLFGWLLRFFDKLLHQFVIYIVADLLLLYRSLCDIWRWFSRWLIYSLLWHALVMAQSALARLDYFCKKIVLLRFWSENWLLLWRLDVVSLCLESLVLSGHLPQLSFLELVLELK